jgi:hypothetical protein
MTKKEIKSELVRLYEQVEESKGCGTISTTQILLKQMDDLMARLKFLNKEIRYLMKV